jgi:hypothetical protein
MAIEVEAIAGGLGGASRHRWSCALRVAGVEGQSLYLCTLFVRQSLMGTRTERGSASNVTLGKAPSKGGRMHHSSAGTGKRAAPWRTHSLIGLALILLILALEVPVAASAFVLRRDSLRASSPLSSR